MNRDVAFLIICILFVIVAIVAVLALVLLKKWMGAKQTVIKEVPAETDGEKTEAKAAVAETAETADAAETADGETLVAVGDDTVVFSSDKALTIDDRYDALTDEQKKYYDEIVQYASAVDGCRRFKNARYEEYKVGKNRLVRMLIKRGIIVCEFIMTSNDFKAYVSDNKISVRQAPTILKVVDEDTVKIAKDSIDIAVKAIEEEKEAKREQMRERRRQNRAAKQTGNE